MDERADLTVHSLKDMPMEVPAELPLLAFSKREDPRDALSCRKGKQSGSEKAYRLFQSAQEAAAQQNSFPMRI